jgi:hypothetical protein
MRVTRVYILRLLVDDQDPGHLQGVLSPVSDAIQPRPFRSGQALLDLLYDQATEPAKVQADKTAEGTDRATRSDE